MVEIYMEFCFGYMAYLLRKSPFIFYGCRWHICEENHHLYFMVAVYMEFVLVICHISQENHHLYFMVAVYGVCACYMTYL